MVATDLNSVFRDAGAQDAVVDHIRSLEITTIALLSGVGIAASKVRERISEAFPVAPSGD